MNYDRINNYGVYEENGQVLTFDILSQSQNNDLNRASKYYGEIPKKKLWNWDVIRIMGYNVAVYGKDHNNLPLELRDMVSENHILPELIEKQIKYLYGQGPYLYRIESNEINHKKRIPVFDTEIEEWLESWQKNGIEDSYQFYLLKNIREFYYTEGVFSKYIFNKARRLSGKMPIRGLENVSSNIARLATEKEIRDLNLLNNRDFNKVITGNWLYPVDFEFNVHNRLDLSNVLAYANAINYTKNNSFAEEIYSYPSWYYGLREWIKGSNLTPRYINSFLKNSLSAKLHVVIPFSWVDKKMEVLKRLCEKNRELEENKLPLVNFYQGAKIGTEYNDKMIDELIQFQLKKITELMSGSGENQGKIFASWKINGLNGVEEWEFKEIPLKYKEFIESIIKYDERAVRVILESKGIDASLSNVSKDGIESKSGSDIYYNYLIYLQVLDIAELVCTFDINLAIQTNFPDKKGIKLGFYHDIPSRQQEVSPDERFTSQKK